MSNVYTLNETCPSENVFRYGSESSRFDGQREFEPLQERFECNSYINRLVVESTNNYEFAQIFTTIIDSLTSSMESHGINRPYYIYCSPSLMSKILGNIARVDSFANQEYFGTPTIIFGNEVIPDHNCEDEANFRTYIKVTNVKQRPNKHKAPKVFKEKFPVIYKLF